MADSSGPNGDRHPIGGDLLKLLYLLDEPGSFGLFGGQHNGCGSSIKRLQDVFVRLCVCFNNLSSNLDVTTQALGRFIDASKGLSLGEAPVVLMEKESGERLAGSISTPEKNWNSRAPDVTNGVDMDRSR